MNVSADTEDHSTLFYCFKRRYFEKLPESGRRDASLVIGIGPNNISMRLFRENQKGSSGQIELGREETNQPVRP